MHLRASGRDGQDGDVLAHIGQRGQRQKERRHQRRQHLQQRGGLQRHCRPEPLPFRIFFFKKNKNIRNEQKEEQQLFGSWEEEGKPESN